MLAFGIIWYMLVFTGPYFFVDRPLLAPAVAHLRDGASKRSAWATSPTVAAIEFLRFGVDPAEPLQIRTKVSVLTPTDAVVMVFDSDGGDSVYLTCDRLTMRLENNVWIPVRDQQAWQGRGRIGWTTQPCL
jgi:hypothetical protein